MDIGWWNSPPVMLARLTQSAIETMHALRRQWLLLLGFALVGSWIGFAIILSDEQGRMDLPLAYSIRMTCEDDIESSLWHGGCERIAADIAKTGRPSFVDLYNAFATVHHAPGPREASVAHFVHVAPDAGFDVAAMLSGQRYGLASILPEFEGVKNRAHAEVVIDEIDARDRALLAIGRAGLGYDALIAGALANLAHPRAMVDGAAQYVAILMGTAKRSDIATGLSPRR